MGQFVVPQIAGSCIATSVSFDKCVDNGAKCIEIVVGVQDTDVMIWEGDTSDPTRKPPEMYTLIENFCLGLRRLEIFGRARTMRRGWVTALSEGEEERIEEGMTVDGDRTDSQEGAKRWNREVWEARVKELSNGGKAVVPMTPGTCQRYSHERSGSLDLLDLVCRFFIQLQR